MTAVYTLKLPFLFKKKLLRSMRNFGVTFVIPVFNDSCGLSRTLASIEIMAPGIRAIVVDDGSNPSEKMKISEIAKKYNTVTLIHLTTNRGAGHARNVGVENVSTEWIAFIDCDCILSPQWLKAFKHEVIQGNETPICLCGPVKGHGKGIIPMYMEEQGILNPPMLDGAPQTIVTANAVVWKEAFVEVRGFSEQYPGAGGEDFDLGFKLFQIGHIQFATAMAVSHRFPDSLEDFSLRFFRYGRANKLLEQCWGGDFQPASPKSVSPIFEQLAEMQYREMVRGYNSIKG